MLMEYFVDIRPFCSVIIFVVFVYKKKSSEIAKLIGVLHGQPRVHDLLVTLQVRESLEGFAASLTGLWLATFVFPMVLQMALIDERSTAFAIHAVLQSLFAFDTVNGGGQKMTTTVFHFANCWCHRIRCTHINLTNGVMQQINTHQDIPIEKEEIRQKCDLGLVIFEIFQITCVVGYILKRNFPVPN